jgi:hypothetical protein
VDNCIENNTSICKISKNGDKCVVSFPANNLVTKMPNEEYYFGRMADELIRYNRIKSFIFKPQAYLSFGQIKYNLRDNEIIVLQDMLTQEFFDTMIPSDINNYAKYNTYDNTQPFVSQAYKSEIPIDEIINPNRERDCNASEPAKISSGYWSNCFPKSYKEVSYKGSRFCALYLIIDLVKKFNGNTLTVEDVKSDLVDEYKRLVTRTDDENEGELIIDFDRSKKIIDFLIDEGQNEAKQLLNKTLTFEQMILHDGFSTVNFDLWVLLNKYEIPSILISSKPLPETNKQRTEFVCYKSTNDIYAFIVVPAMYSRQNKTIPEYKVIVNADGNEQININEIPMTDNQCIVSINEAINNEDNTYSIEEFFDDNIFIKRAYKKHVYKKVANKVSAEEKSESISFESEPSEDLKASRKEGLELVKSVINVEALKEEAPIQTPKKTSTKKASTKKGGKKVTRRRR